MKLAICGSRDYIADVDELSFLVSCYFGHEIDEIVSGGAAGVDASAERFCVEFMVPKKIFPADLDTHGKAAGPIRNREIAEYADALLVLRFLDSKGSINVASEFRKRNKKVIEIILSR